MANGIETEDDKVGDITKAVNEAQRTMTEIDEVSATILKKLSPVLNPVPPRPQSEDKELSNVPLLKEIEILTRRLRNYYCELLDLRKRINI